MKRSTSDLGFDKGSEIRGNTFLGKNAAGLACSRCHLRPSYVKGLCRKCYGRDWRADRPTVKQRAALDALHREGRALLTIKRSYLASTEPVVWINYNTARTLVRRGDAQFVHRQDGIWLEGA